MAERHAMTSVLAQLSAPGSPTRVTSAAQRERIPSSPEREALLRAIGEYRDASIARGSDLPATHAAMLLAIDALELAAEKRGRRG